MRQAHAEDGVAACIAAHAKGQELRTSQQLTAAREQFTRCSAADCPALIRNDCGQFLAQVDASIPTVSLGAVDADERPLPDVRIDLDGRPFTAPLNGAAASVDPGAHQFRFRAPDGQIRELTVTLREGDKNREVLATFGSPASAASDRSSFFSRVPTVSYVLGGVGVAALGSFAFFGLRGRSTESCKPNCTDDEVSSLRGQYLAADISLLIGAGALGAATYLYFHDQSEHAGQRARPTVRVAAAPHANGLTFGAVGTF